MTSTTVAAVRGWRAFASVAAPSARGRGRQRQARRRLARDVVLGAILALTVATALVWVRLQVVRTGYELSAARRLEHRLQQEQRELELEIATLGSPRRLERLARERLGMRPPAPGQVVGAP